MATVEKTVELIFAGVDKTTGVLGTIGSGLKGLDDTAQRLAAPLAKVTDTILKVDAALAALAVGGLVLAFQKSSEFESALIDLEKVIGDQPAQLAAAKKAALDFSTTYGQSGTDILATIGSFKQAGFELQDSIQLTEDAIKLAIAGELDMDSATRVLIQSLKGFQAPATDASRIVDALNITSQEYATNVEQLADAMARSAPIANQMGFSFEELVGVLTPMIEVFQNGEITGRAFNTILQRMQIETGPVGDAMELLDVKQRDVNDQMRSGKDIFYDVAEAFKTLAPAQQSVVAQQLAGTDQAAKLIAVFRDFNKVADITTLAMESVDSQTFEVEKRLASAEIAVARMKTGFENLAIAVGDEFRDAATRAINGGTAIENTLMGLVQRGAFDDFSSLLNEALNSISETLEGIASALPDAFQQVDFGPLIGHLRDLGVEVAGIFGGVDLTQPDQLAKAIQAAVDTIDSLVVTTQGIWLAFEPIFNAIVGAVQSFNQLSDQQKLRIGQDILGTAKLVHEGGLAIIATLKLIGGELDAWGNSWSRVFNAAGAVVDAFKAIWNAVSGAIAQGLSTVLKQIDAATFGMIPGLEGAAQAIEDFGKSEWSDFIESTKDATENVEGFLATFDDDFQRAPDYITAIGEALDFIPSHAQAATDAIEFLPSHITKTGDAAKTAAKPVADVGRATGDAALQTGDFSTKTDAATKTLYGFTQGADGVWRNTDKIGTSANAATDSLYGFTQGADGVWRNAQAIADSTQGASQGISNVDGSASRAAGTLNQAAQHSEAFRLKMAALDRDFAATQLTLAVDLKVAQIEAETAQIEAAFRSLSDVVGSTGDVILGLFNQLAGAQAGGNIFLSNQIQAAIAREELRRQQAFLQQQQLVDAQIASLNLRNQVLQQGGALIQIDSTGLSPALELVMFEILEKVQLRVNAAAADFLLGV